MKTIKDAAIDNCKNEIRDGEKNDTLFSSREGMQLLLERTFKNGVEFAQKWIKVEEEFPKHRDVVLAKVPLINYPLLFAYNEIESKWYQFDEGDFFESEINPTCWRPIERI